MKIYLLGYMGSGKTNLGREMSELSGMKFADMDDLFEGRYKVSILEFFGKYDEELFRRLEREILLGTEGMDDCVISTGGGAPCFFNNMDFIRAQGRSVYLKMSVPALTERLSSIRKKRPLLQNIPPEELERHIMNQLLEREPFYLRADLVLEGPDFSAADVLEKIRRL